MDAEIKLKHLVSVVDGRDILNGVVKDLYQKGTANLAPEDVISLIDKNVWKECDEDFVPASGLNSKSDGRTSDICKLLRTFDYLDKELKNFENQSEKLKFLLKADTIMRIHRSICVSDSVWSDAIPIDICTEDWTIPNIISVLLELYDVTKLMQTHDTEAKDRESLTRLKARMSKFGDVIVPYMETPDWTTRHRFMNDLSYTQYFDAIQNDAVLKQYLKAEDVNVAYTSMQNVILKDTKIYECKWDGNSISCGEGVKLDKILTEVANSTLEAIVINDASERKAALATLEWRIDQLHALPNGNIRTGRVIATFAREILGLSPCSYMNPNIIDIVCPAALIVAEKAGEKLHHMIMQHLLRKV
ncbi:hypothetical protein [Vibrio neptunius]|uniref:hypothetical protein n=1 Tax=Vibrio neptunius TaxID=170651 RepID=UPI0019D1FF86|nr:hypothetical protein [Vibrio neptunius]MBN3571641.1 hypothetical protein [Vibrio neptunius]QXX05432.1 hypothetical protein KW548_09180 [Vibrio neptunius]